METFTSLRESRDDKYMESINAYLRTVKEKGVKVINANEGSYITEAEIDMKPFLKEKVVFEYGGHREYFNVFYHEFGSVRLCAEDFVESFGALGTLRDAVRSYIKENNVKSHETLEGDNQDHSWLLSNNGWM